MYAMSIGSSFKNPDLFINVQTCYLIVYLIDVIKRTFFSSSRFLLNCFDETSIVNYLCVCNWNRIPLPGKHIITKFVLSTVW